jgi:hypothetical protein
MSIASVNLSDDQAEVSVSAFNWHPAVHTNSYREQLYFFLVRFREPHYTPVASQLRRILMAAGVAHACEYTIFGYWDGLIRAWLTPGSHNRLRGLIDAPESNIDECRTLTATSLYYLWHSEEDLLKGSRDLLGSLARFERQISEVVASEASADAVVVNELKGAELVFFRPAAPAGSVKFYLVLERAGEPMTRRKQISLVLKALNAAKMTARASLYVGEGDLAVYMVRCVADSYQDVLAWTAALDAHLADTKLRAMTLLVANADALESDHVNDPAVISQAAETTLQLLGLEGNEHQERALLGALEAEDQMAFGQIVQRAYERALPGTDLQERLTAILCASIRDDRAAFKASLAFLVDIEYYLGTYLVRAWSDVFGRNWLRIVCDQLQTGDKNACRAAAEMEKPLAEWTLGPYAYGAQETARINEMFASRLNRQMGPDWRKRLKSLHTLRNDFSHGRLARLEWLRDYSGKGGKLLIDIIDACAFCGVCTNLAESDASRI